MTINNPGAFCASLWDWACLDGCFGETRIKPTDGDGEVERHGYFLRFETKLPGVEIPQGQMLTFQHLINTKVFTVIVIWGYPGNPEKMWVMTRTKTYEFEQADLNLLRHWVEKWFSWANSMSEPMFN